MDNFLLKDKELLNSLESVAFIVATLAVLGSFLAYALYRYQSFKKKIRMKAMFFNHGVFEKDRSFFEAYGEKPSLEPADFTSIHKDPRFLEHLMKKEAGYYTQITEIAEGLDMLKMFRRGWFALGGALALWLAVAWLLPQVLRSLHA